MSILTERPGDRTRRRAQAKEAVRAHIELLEPGALFCATDVCEATGVTFATVVSQLDALTLRGSLVVVDKPGDARRHWRKKAPVRA